jgi:hypothetical protein
LLFDRKLRMIRIVEEDGIVLQGCYEGIKCSWADTKILSEMIGTSRLERYEDVVEV